MAQVRVVLHGDWLRQQVLILQGGRRQPGIYPAGLNVTAAGTEWLGGRFLGNQTWGPRGCLVLAVGEQARGLADLAARSLAHAWPGTHAVAVALGIGESSGHLAAAALREGEVVTAERVRVVGPGWLSLPAESAGLEPIAAGEYLLSPEVVWSRTIGALGERAWRGLCELAVAVVGCGRTGSLVVPALARLGVRRLFLVDPDRIEPHNLGEMLGANGRSLGRFKAEALERSGRGQSLWPVPMVEPVTASVLSLRALRAVQEADVVVCAVDNPTARLHVACLAAFYLRPLLDLGTAILPSGGERDETVGADVRLLLPGRCLLDLGGIAGWQAARDDLLAGRGLEPAAPDPQGWRRQRGGSLLSLNGLAVHLGLRLLEELVRGRVERSTWLRVETANDGVPRWARRQAARSPECRLCRWVGAGDGAVAVMPEVLRQL